MQPIRLTGNDLTFADVAAVARSGCPVELAPDARERMSRTRAWVDGVVGGPQSMAVYGVNTGYGSLARVRIDDAHIAQLSWNLVRSHAAGVGPAVSPDAVRAMMLLRANALAKGASGVRPELVDTLCAMLRSDVVPVVPSRGSCGSSGDLAPLSHLGLVVFRGPDDEDAAESGEAWFAGARVPGATAMREAGIPRLVPAPKEGLGMINGAQLTCAIAALTVVDACEVVLASEIACAMSFEGLLAVTRALHPGVHALRPYRGAVQTAANLRRLLEGSTLVDALPDKVQDAYSLRCTPQVVGAARDGIRFAAEQIAIELNAVTDNPVILLDAQAGPEGENKAFSAGLFHGEPVGLAADHLKLCVSEVGAISERRIYRLTTGNLSARLPPLLAERDGLRLGLMMPQVSAAALVGHNRQLAYPASADSIPTCEDQEDHVAMSTTAARRAAEVVDNTRQIVAIELLAATKALWARLSDDPGAKLGIGTRVALAVVEERLGGRRTAAAPADDIEKLVELVREGALTRAVQDAVGPLAGVIDG
ncbi:MAG: histidine ammonia-lyase [Myxococcota bacterium]